MSLSKEAIEQTLKKQQELYREFANDIISGKFRRDDFCDETWSNVEPIVQELLAGNKANLLILEQQSSDQ